MKKLGIAGTGIIVQEVLPLVGQWGFEPAAICGTPQTEAQTKELAEKYTNGVYYNSYAEMLKDENVEVIYVAVPNFLHYSFVKDALAAKKNVICEKPLTSNVTEARQLEAAAKDAGLFLFEAITTVYLPTFLKTRELLSRIGTVKVVSCNFSNYSRRYDAFRAGEILPAFDPKKSGGALMDIGLYNLAWLVGLFGEPQSVKYDANIERGIDTSGIMTLDYGTFKAVSVAAKDCSAPWRYVIQGTEGYLLMDTPANFCMDIKIHLNDGTEEKYVLNPKSRLECEFLQFAKLMEENNLEACYEALAETVLVSKIQTEARLGAGIIFPADEK
ncbi:MAG: Gfo/Idh/MocA family oxidoreductase [Solobacterium sp.]|nr:Gfo/Idh/MocA family oxidoreductase [Solobacterium sp.]